MKYLKLFKTESDYTSSEGSFSYPTVSYTIQTKTINMVPIHKRPIKAVFYDSATNTFIKVLPDNIKYVETYTPIGVEVIPVEHDVYGDGTCGVMSLAEMNLSTPDVGSSDYQGMYWGGYQIDTSLPNYGVCNYIGSNGNLNNGAVQGTTRYACLPSDLFSTVTGLDGHSNYYYNDPNKYIPSPFNADGSRNEAYYTTAYSTANALSDFGGVGNTKIITDLATAQSDWKTATTITNSDGTGYYPAACCVWRFHTVGTVQGQWYLPACGELGYVINRISAINTTINKVLSVYSSVVAVAVNTSNYYWSSSEYSVNIARSLYTPNGNVGDSYKDYNLYNVRAFLRV